LRAVCPGSNGGEKTSQFELKFDRQQLIGAIGDEDGDVAVRIDGALSDGNRFSGTGSVQVIH
jgi:hypothetical protein